MFETLAEVRATVTRLAAGFEPSRVTVGDAARIRDEAAGIARVLGAITAQAAARAAQSGAWRQAGARSAAHELAQLTGTSVGQAARVLETGHRLETLPRVAQAAAAGGLSAPQLDAVADAASVDPGATDRLLEVAARTSLAELEHECRRAKAAADRDAEAERARIHRARSLRSWTDRDGVGHVHLADNPEVTAAVMAAVRAESARTRGAGAPERAEALAADALVALVTRRDPAAPGRPGSSGAKLLVRVDLDTLLRGYPTDGEVCEIVGHGPVAVSAVTDLIASGDPFLAAVATRGQQVLGVAHLGRHPTTHQDSALEWLYPTCAREGCGRSTRLERDHRLPWADSKVTLLDLLDRLCAHDHDLHTHHGWALVDGVGRRPMVPPDDPRHPRHAAATTTRPPP